MTKKFLTAVGLVFATIIVIICCATIPFKKFELAGGATVKLYLDGSCVYEEINSVTSNLGRNKEYYTSDYNRFPVAIGTLTSTLTKTYYGTYKKTGAHIYSIDFTELNIKSDVSHDLDPAEELMYFKNNFNSIGTSVTIPQFQTFPQFSEELLKTLQGQSASTVQITGDKMYVELDDNGNVIKHKKYHLSDIYDAQEESGVLTIYKYFDEYIYTYDDNGSLESYLASINNPIETEGAELQYNMYNSHNDYLGDGTYEYTYYEDGTVKTVSSNFDKYEYYPNGVVHHSYQYIDGKLFMHFEYDENSNLIRISSAYNNYGYPTVGQKYEYNDDGTIKSYKHVSNGQTKSETIKNYTYKTEKYPNGVIKFAEMYINDKLITRVEYYETGVLKFKQINKDLTTTLDKYNENGIRIETQSFIQNELGIIIRYDDLTGIAKSRYKRYSSMDEFVNENRYEKHTVYDDETKTTLHKFYYINNKDAKFITQIYALDENSQLTYIENFIYDSKFETFLGSYKIKVVDSNTLTRENYDTENNLYQIIYYKVTSDGLKITYENVATNS